jgi:hypothetical protein
MSNVHFLDAKRINQKAASIRDSLARMRRAETGFAELIPGDGDSAIARDKLLAEILLLRAQLDRHCARLEVAAGQMRAAVPEEDWMDQRWSRDLSGVLLAARAALADTFAIADLLVSLGAVPPAEVGC